VGLLIPPRFGSFLQPADHRGLWANISRAERKTDLATEQAIDETGIFVADFEKCRAITDRMVRFDPDDI
jgi:hypothetical protein